MTTTELLWIQLGLLACLVGVTSYPLFIALALWGIGLVGKWLEKREGAND
jgi:hypothetical protein